MVNKFMTTLLVRDYKAEWGATMTDVYRRANDDGILRGIVRKIHERILDNILGSGFEMWMHSNEFLSDVIPNGLLRIRKFQNRRF